MSVPMPPPAPPPPPPQFPAAASPGYPPPPLPALPMTFSEPITDLGDDAVDPALGNGFAGLVDRPTRLRAASSPEWSTVTLVRADGPMRHTARQPVAFYDERPLALTVARIPAASLPDAPPGIDLLSRLRMVHRKLIPGYVQRPVDATWQQLGGLPAVLDRLCQPAGGRICGFSLAAPVDDGGLLATGWAPPDRTETLQRVAMPLATLARPDADGLAWASLPLWSTREELQISTSSVLATATLEPLQPGQTLTEWTDVVYRRAPFLRGMQRLGDRPVTVRGVDEAWMSRFDWQPSGRGRSLTTVVTGTSSGRRLQLLGGGALRGRTPAARSRRDPGPDRGAPAVGAARPAAPAGTALPGSPAATATRAAGPVAAVRTGAAGVRVARRPARPVPGRRGRPADDRGDRRRFRRSLGGGPVRGPGRARRDPRALGRAAAALARPPRRRGTGAGPDPPLVGRCRAAGADDRTSRADVGTARRLEAVAALVAVEAAEALQSPTRWAGERAPGGPAVPRGARRRLGRLAVHRPGRAGRRATASAPSSTPAPGTCCGRGTRTRRRAGTTRSTTSTCRCRSALAQLGPVAGGPARRPQPRPVPRAAAVHADRSGRRSSPSTRRASRSSAAPSGRRTSSTTSRASPADQSGRIVPTTCSVPLVALRTAKSQPPPACAVDSVTVDGRNSGLRKLTSTLSASGSRPDERAQHAGLHPHAVRDRPLEAERLRGQAREVDRVHVAGDLGVAASGVVRDPPGRRDPLQVADGHLDVGLRRPLGRLRARGPGRSSASARPPAPPAETVAHRSTAAPLRCWAKFSAQTSRSSGSSAPIGRRRPRSGCARAPARAAPAGTSGRSSAPSAAGT